MCIRDRNTIYGLDNTYDPDILVTMVNVEGTQTVFAVWSYDTNGDGTPDVQDAVSYTHLDVYKRQQFNLPAALRCRWEYPEQ